MNGYIYQQEYEAAPVHRSQTLLEYSSHLAMTLQGT
jgi:hypothetical protein